MINITNITRQILLASVAVMAATGEASAHAPIAVITQAGLPYFASPQAVNSKPLGQFAFHTHVCITGKVYTWNRLQFLQYVLPSGELVYTLARKGIIARDPAGNKSCRSKVASTALTASIPPPVQRAPQTAPNYVAPPTMAASSGTSAQSPEQPPSEANQAKSNVGGTGADARTLEDGLAAEKRGDWKAAFLLLEPLAKHGNADAQTQIGFMYETGRGVWHGRVVNGVAFPDRFDVQDGTVALVWYRKAADQGNAQAEVGLGRVLKHALGPNPAAYAAAMTWFRKAADQGNAEGQFQLGYMYYEGKGGIPQDLAEAMKWFRKAADQGNADAQEKLAQLDNQAEKLAQLNNQAKANVGGTGADAGALEAGLAAEERGDWKAALMLLKPLAEQGNPRAQVRLGAMYYNGEGVPKDYAEAMTWFRKAADQGNSDGQNNVGAMYDNGEGVPKDYVEAIKWYRKSASQGNANAQFRLGVLLEDALDNKSLASLGGEIFDRLLSSKQDISLEEQHYAEVMEWFRKSADQGNMEGQNELGRLYYEGRMGVPKDYAEALKWYRKSADQGYAAGQYNIGLMYEAGDGVPRDYAEALKWYKKAADQGDVEAQKSFALLTKYRPMLEAKKDVADTVCYPSRCTDSYCVPYGQVENVHDDKIEVRVHVQENGTWISTGLFSGTTIPGQAHDQLNWINYNDVIKCE